MTSYKVLVLLFLKVVEFRLLQQDTTGLLGLWQLIDVKVF